MRKIFWSDRNVIREQRFALRLSAEQHPKRDDAMKKSALTRIRTRIRARLEELGMTGRELAEATGHKDAWISGILSGYQSLGWEDFDAVAEKLGLSPSELIRHDDAVVRELTPREMRLLRHYQAWPPDMQDRWMAMLDFFAASVPDKETAVLLDRVRALPRSVRRPVLAWLFRLLEEGIPPEASTGGVVLGADEVPTAPSTPRPSPARKRRSG
jgi:transcriptional regulator with XRE-family HTH domain